MGSHVYGISFYGSTDDSLIKLDRCLSSLNNQITSSKLEVILYNDGSTLVITNVLKDKLNKYTNLNITYLSNITNKGVWYGRNKIIEESLRQAHNYLMFLDADDVIHSTTLDFSASNFLKDDHFTLCIPFLRELISPEGERAFTVISNEYNWLHGKFYNLRVLRESGIRFPEVRTHEDVYFSLLLETYFSSNVGKYGFINHLDPNLGLFSIVWTNNKGSLSNTDREANLSNNIKALVLAYEKTNSDSILSILGLNLYLFDSLLYYNDNHWLREQLSKPIKSDRTIKALKSFYSDMLSGVYSSRSYKEAIVSFFVLKDDKIISSYREIYGHFDLLELSRFYQAFKTRV